MKNRHFRRTIAVLIAACMIFENLLTSLATSGMSENKDPDCLLGRRIGSHNGRSARRSRSLYRFDGPGK